jgi:hypothetical protein
VNVDGHTSPDPATLNLGLTDGISLFPPNFMRLNLPGSIETLKTHLMEDSAGGSSGPEPSKSTAAAEEAVSGAGEAVSIAKIQDLLRAKNDTSRFVGLALLKSLLDGSTEIRDDEAAVLRLWSSISAKFLDRLIRTGAGPNASKKDAKDMLDIAVAVIHAFVVLLPDPGKQSKLTDRIPSLVAAVLQRQASTLRSQQVAE